MMDLAWINQQAKDRMEIATEMSERLDGMEDPKLIAVGAATLAIVQVQVDLWMMTFCICERLEGKQEVKGGE
jgi:hypothetical protein